MFGWIVGCTIRRICLFLIRSLIFCWVPRFHLHRCPYLYYIIFDLFWKQHHSHGSLLWDRDHSRWCRLLFFCLQFCGQGARLQFYQLWSRRLIGIRINSNSKSMLPFTAQTRSYLLTFYTKKYRHLLEKCRMDGFSFYGRLLATNWIGTASFSYFNQGFCTFQFILMSLRASFIFNI